MQGPTLGSRNKGANRQKISGHVRPEIFETLKFKKKGYMAFWQIL